MSGPGRVKTEKKNEFEVWSRIQLDSQDSEFTIQSSKRLQGLEGLENAQKGPRTPIEVFYCLSLSMLN